MTVEERAAQRAPADAAAALATGFALECPVRRAADPPADLIVATAAGFAGTADI